MSIESEKSPPGCLLLLLQLSASMKIDVPSYRGEFPKNHLARLLADEVVEDLVAGHVEGIVAGNFDVSIVGYSQSKEGPPDVSLLPDDKTQPHFLSVAQLAKLDVPKRRAADQPRKWTANVGEDGEANPSAALAAAHWIVQRWQADHPRALPPIIVHCCDGEGLTNEYDLIVRSLSMLQSGGKPPFLAHCVFSEIFSGRMLPFQYCGHLADPVERLWKSSSVLDSQQPNCRGHAPRALTINEWPRSEIRQVWHRLAAPPPPLQLAPEPEPLPELEAVLVEERETVQGDVLDLPPEIAEPAPIAITTPAAVAGTTIERLPFFSYRTFWLVKRGNDANQWEDAYCVDPLSGAVAICDGAGAGIFCRQWAALLAERWVRDRPDVLDPAAYRAWIDSCRAVWMDAIGYKTIRIFQRMKVDDVGAAATLVGMRIERDPIAKEYRWHAAAVGDSVLFWVRDGNLMATFPITHGSQFDNAPHLLRSKRIASPGFAQAGGVCQTGDLFVLATDAVAHALFDEHDRGPVDWARFETLEQADWEQEMERLRDENRMVNDDCTLIVLRVGAPEVKPPQTVNEPAANVEDAEPLPVSTDEMKTESPDE